MKNELTLEEWKEIGIKTKEVRDNVNDLLTLLSDKLPNGQYLSKWKSANKSFDNLRSHLDEIVCSKFTELPDREIIHIFFGSDEKK